jgi:hypothetical protein
VVLSPIFFSRFSSWSKKFVQWSGPGCTPRTVSTLAALESEELSSESEIGCGRGRGGASMDERRREDMVGVAVLLVKS